MSESKIKIALTPLVVFLGLVALLATSRPASAGAATPQLNEAAPTSFTVVYGQPVVGQLYVSAVGGGAPGGNGTLVFTNTTTGITLGTLPLNGTLIDQAFDFPTLPVGTANIDISYGGDGNYAARDFGTVYAITVTQDTTATTLAVGTNPALTGEPVSLTATVTATAPSTAIPTGPVQFLDGTTVIATAPLVGGSATASVSFLPGSHVLSATYANTTDFVDSTTGTTTTEVIKSNTTITVSGSPNPSGYNQALGVTAVVTPTQDGAVTPTGSITFSYNGTSLGSAPLIAGSGATASAVLNNAATASLPPGADTIVATYAGDSDNNGATGSYAQTVSVAATTVTLSTTPLTPPTHVVGETVTLTATVSATAPATNTPTGPVSFFNAGSLVGVASLSGGTAHVTTTFPAAGLQSLSVVYWGDPLDAPSTGSTTDQVNAASTTSTLTSSAIPSVSGQTITLTDTIAAVAPGSGDPEGGTITFKDGLATIGSGTVTNGVATAQVALAEGSHSLSAVFASNANYGTSTGLLTQGVGQAASATTVTSNINPSSLGQTVTFTAAVASVAPGNVTPATGTVTFSVNGVALASPPVTLIAGSASVPISTLPNGANIISATYNGSTDLAESTSVNYDQAVGIAATTTTLGAAPSPAVVGQSVVLTATVAAVAPATNTPTGTVSFYNSGTFLGLGNLSAGVGTVTVTFPASGLQSLTAVYSGDPSDAPSTGSTTDQINAAGTSSTLTSSANPSVSGQTITLIDTVIAASPGAGTPNGASVSFLDGANPIGAGTVVNGVARAQVALARGSHSLSAVLTGNANYGTSTGLLTQVVNQASSSTTVSSDINPSALGQTVTLTATVAALAPGSGTPTGTVTFSYAGNPLSALPVNLVAGVATLAVSSLPAGADQIQATYSGDSNFSISTSPFFTQTVNVGGTTVAVLSSDNPSITGEPVTLTATVAPTAPNGTTPTGTVSFYNTGVFLGQGTLDGAGVTSITTTFETAQTASITAVYSGDLSNVAGTGSLTQVVDSADTTSVLSSNIASPVSGQSVTLTDTITPTGPATGTPDGSTITFEDNGVPIGTGTVAGGIATLTVTLVTGTHPLTAVFAGTPDYNASTGATSLIVGQASSTTSVTSDINPSNLGQSITLTATVAPAAPGSGTPTGSVTFMMGGSTLGSGAQTLAGGTATLVISNLPAGVDQISVVYGGDSEFTGSTSAFYVQSVGVATTETAVTSATNPSVTGQPVTLTATVSNSAPGFGTPTGAVSFYDSGVFVAQANLDNTGAASITTPFLTASAHSITATYSGDSGHAPSTSPLFTQNVNAAATSVALASTPSASVSGQLVTLSAVVTATAPGAGVPAGTVTFSDGANPLGTTKLVNGVAALTTSFLVGSQSLTASYTGSPNFASSTTAAPVTLTVSQASSATSLSATPSPSGLGQAVVFTIAVSAIAPGTGTPTGGVVVMSNGATVGTGLLTNGATTVTVTTLAVGVDEVVATYIGDAQFVGSTSANYPQVVGPVATTVTLTSSTNPTVYGQATTFTATVANNAAGYGAPTGSVVFYNGSTAIGQATLNGSSVATLTTSQLPVGSYSITAVYAGDLAHLTSTSSVVTQAVDAGAVTVTVTAAPNPVVLNQTVAYSATVAGVSPAVGTPDGTVTFMDGAITLGTAPVIGGVANLSATAPTVIGDNSITAVYSGSVNWAGLTSLAYTLVVDNPLPMVGSLQPSSAQEGSGAVTISVVGSNFIATSVIQVNGTSLTTTVVSASNLTALLPAADLANEGTLAITVVNPVAGGGTSAPLTFTVVDAPLTATGTVISAESTVSYTGVVANFHDGDISAPSTDYSATIDWEDGTSSPGDGNAVTFESNGNGNYSVVGTHVYSAPDGETFAPVITITDIGGASVSVTATAVIGPPVAVLAAGLQLTSLPYDYSTSALNAAEIFGLTVLESGFAPIVAYDPVAKVYDLYPALPGLNGVKTLPGHGYWVRLSATTQIVGTGTIVASPFQTSLSPGWNLIGDPFTTPVLWSSVQFIASTTVNGKSAGSLLSLADVQAGGLVSSDLFGYSIGQNAYEASTTLVPFQGYWVYVDPIASGGQTVSVRYTNPAS